LMLVAVAVGIYYIARTASDDEDDTSEIPSTSGMGNTAPSPSPSPSEEEPVLAPFDTTFLESDFPTPTPAYDGQDLVDLEQTLLTISRAQDLEDADTPQGTCSHWLSQKDGQSLRVSKAGPERIVQRYVLCTLYYATNGDGWTMPFLDGTLHECDWTGVYCHQDGDIVHIVDLPAINLVGSLPEELIYLEHLEGLILSGNSLTGTLPSQLFELSSLLVFFDLSNNLLAGELPDVWDAPNLSSLDLHSNQFLRSFPAQLLELTSLVYLDLADNNLRGPIPTPLRDDSPLEVLRLYENQFSGTLPFFPQLQELDVYSNNIIQIDSRYATSETLKLLVAYDNLLVNKLPEKWDAPNLSYLDLHSNQLTGTIPLSIWSLTKLETLILHVNGLTGTLPAKTSSSFKHVWLHSNNFSGTLDEDFGAIWINLTTMLLYGNQLTGLVDGQCRGWSQLERLEVDCDLMCNCCTADCKQ
jgi:hypothetical protein